MPSEVDSKALSDEYLKNLDFFYKQQYLKEISVSSELLVYDWSNGGETEIVVEDIERIGAFSMALYLGRLVGFY